MKDIRENLFEILFFLGFGILSAGLYLIYGTGIALSVSGGILMVFAFVLILLESGARTAGGYIPNKMSPTPVPPGEE